MCSRLFEFTLIIQIIVIFSLTNQIHGNLSIICGQVPTGEFVRSSISCNTYNYCYNGQTHTATCPHNFLFNAKKQICDRAELVDCTECSDRGVQHIADPRNCRKYYRCALGVRVHRTCPNGLRFDPKIGNCNFDTHVSCTEQSICAPYGHSGAVYIGNPQDCNSYFMCFKGLEVKHYCQNGLYFNSIIGICEQYPTNCQSSSGPINVVTESPSVGITTTTISPTTPAPTFTPQCSNYISFGFVFISNPYDCSSYFSCYNGILYNHKCAENTYYNAYTTQCGAFCEGSGQIIVQTPQVTSSTSQPTTSTTVRQTTVQTTTARTTTTTRPIVTSTQQITVTVPSFTTIPPTLTTPLITTTLSPPTTTTPPPTTTTPAPTTTTPAPTTTTPAPTTTTTPPPTTTTALPVDSRCITNPTGNNFVSCTSFANCVGGVFNYISNCVVGTYFNQVTGACSTVIPPGCVELTTLPPTTTTVAGTDPRCIRLAGYFLIAGSCTEYVYCIRGAVRFEYTCDEGMFYDIMTERCTSTRPDGC